VAYLHLGEMIGGWRIGSPPSNRCMTCRCHGQCAKGILIMSLWQSRIPHHLFDSHYRYVATDIRPKGMVQTAHATVHCFTGSREKAGRNSLYDQTLNHVYINIYI